MKNIIFVSFIIVLSLFIGCSDSKKNFFYDTSNCNDTKKDCLNQCRIDGKPQARCANECEKVRGMCEAIKVKGCLQNCNLQYGKNTSAAEQCKLRCNRK